MKVTVEQRQHARRDGRTPGQVITEGDILFAEGFADERGDVPWRFVRATQARGNGKTGKVLVQQLEREAFDDGKARPTGWEQELYDTVFALAVTGDEPPARSFVGEVNAGYTIIDQRGEFVPGKSDAVVLGWKVVEGMPRYVTWHADRDGRGNSRFYWGNYEWSTGALERAVKSLSER